MGLSCFLTAGLSPTALFFPITNLMHFLLKSCEYWRSHRIRGTHSSEMEYKVLRWDLRSITIAMMTEDRIKGMGSGMSFGFVSWDSAFTGASAGRSTSICSGH